MLTRYSAILLLTPLLYACATGPRIVIADDIYYPALPSASLVDEKTITRHIVINRDGKSERFLLQMETGKDRLAAVAMTGFGQKLFQLQYTNDRLNIDALPFSQISLTPGELFADLQLIFWPADALQKHFAGPRVIFSDTHNPYTRNITLDGVPHIEIRYTAENPFNSEIIFRRLDRPYETRIEPAGEKAN